MHLSCVVVVVGGVRGGVVVADIELCFFVSVTDEVLRPNTLVCLEMLKTERAADAGPRGWGRPSLDSRLLFSRLFTACFDPELGPFIRPSKS